MHATSPRLLALLAGLSLAACSEGRAENEITVETEARGVPLLQMGQRDESDEEVDIDRVSEPGPDPDVGADYVDVLPPDELDKYTWIDFLELTELEVDSYELGPGGELPAGLPDYLKELDGELVAIEGFMNPTAFDRGGVSAFTLVSDPTFCCFGLTPTLHHFIDTSLPEGERTEFFSIVPIAVFGRLHVGLEEEDGIALSFYRMDADHVFCVY